MNKEGSGPEQESARELDTGARWDRVPSPKPRKRRPGQADLFARSEGLDGDEDAADDSAEDAVESEADGEGDWEEGAEWEDDEGDEDEDEEDVEDEDEEDEWEEDAEDELEEEDAEEEDWWDEDSDDYAPPEISRTLRFGVLSMAPLFLAYELAMSAGGATASSRSVAEVVLSVPLEPLGYDVNVLRRFCLAIGLVLAFVLSKRHVESVVPRALRVVAEGALAAVALGPLLNAAARYAEPFVGPLGAASGARPMDASSVDVQTVLYAMGGAAYEELVFRILALSLAYVVFRRLLLWRGSEERTAGILAAVGAGLVSATIFAASHLEWATAWLGSGGEAFEASAFTWRVCAGILLALLMVWRGVGVAAWAHAFYNLSSLLGWTES